MATVDLATPLLGDFGTQLDVAFGSTFGWIFGHLIVLGMAGILIQSMRKTSLLSKNFEISSAKITIIIINGIVKRLMKKVVFLYKISNSKILFSLKSLEIAGANTLFKLINKNVVKPVRVNKILNAPTS